MLTILPFVGTRYSLKGRLILVIARDMLVLGLPLGLVLVRIYYVLL